MARRPRTALVLGGGGARAAYQAGVLQAVRALLPDATANPFPILCGTSGGSINAALLATRARDFGAATDFLARFWSDIHAPDVYRAGGLGLAAAGMRWALRRRPRALLDNAPLRRLLERTVDFEQLEPAVTGHALLALAVTCSGYASGQSVSFFQGRADLEPWNLGQRVGAHVMLGIDHLMASCALPLLFPAVRMNREHFCDGAMRMLAPLSPAIRLGADKILVLGDGRMADEVDERSRDEDYPSTARIASHALAGLYADPFAADVRHARDINDLLRLIPETERAGAGVRLRDLDLLVIEPSRRLDHMAEAHFSALPGPVRAILRGLGASGPEGGSLVSLILFDSSYTQALVELGYQDALARREELVRFLDIA